MQQPAIKQNKQCRANLLGWPIDGYRQHFFQYPVDLFTSQLFAPRLIAHIFFTELRNLARLISSNFNITRNITTSFYCT